MKQEEDNFVDLEKDLEAMMRAIEVLQDYCKYLRQGIDRERRKGG